MRKLISSINMTLDGFCDHTAMIADEELHANVNDLLKDSDAIIFGRKTYQLMEEGWPPIVAKPTGEKAMDEFAVLIDNISKIVFSRTLKTVIWNNTSLVNGDLEEEVKKLKQQPGGNLLLGSPTLIISLMKACLIDELQFCIHPVVLGKGIPLFQNIADNIDLRLIKTKQYGSGVVLNTYIPASKQDGI